MGSPHSFLGPRWRVRGSYYEVCNCDAPCPCRRQGGRPGTRSQFDTCDFALSWIIRQGHFGSYDLQGLRVALAGRWDNGEPAKLGGPAHPWHVILYIDDRAMTEQQAALADIFLGRAGGTPLQNYAKAIGEVCAVRIGRIEIDHTRGREYIRIGEFVRATTARPFPMAEAMTCGIPGHDRPGQELIAAQVRVSDDPLHWAFTGRCGFATDFEFHSDQ